MHLIERRLVLGGYGSHDLYFAVIMIHSRSINLISMFIGMAIFLVAWGVLACSCQGALQSLLNVFHKAGGRKHFGGPLICHTTTQLRQCTEGHGLAMEDHQWEMQGKRGEAQGAFFSCS